MAIGVGRRQFISALGGASLAWPLTARAQQPTLPVVGFLNQASAKANASFADAFRKGLSDAGFVHGNSVALLVNPRNPPVTEPYVIDVQNAASSLGLELVVLRAGSEREIDDSFAKVAEQHIGVLMVATDAFFLSRIGYVVALALRHTVPTVYSDVEAVMAGGLMSYDTDLSAAYRQQGGYVARILKGEKPGELAVVQPTKFNFVINMGTAKRWALPFQRVCSRSPTR